MSMLKLFHNSKICQFCQYLFSRLQLNIAVIFSPFLRGILKKIKTNSQLSQTEGRNSNFIFNSINRLLNNHGASLESFIKLATSTKFDEISFGRKILEKRFQRCFGLNRCLYYRKLSFTNNCGPIELCSGNHNFSKRLHRILPQVPQIISNRYTPETLLIKNAF